ncbi:aldo/keto reductase [Natronoflexus pectinivorans]|uniref:Diketogulonate reductase-like aldo/keto reductase n=1 Tax=Natronoflexus pectinivorans TaxID=682526 RepID=A0A4R2GDK6_9BACT|nr:aldo/keto reductase [Natronoflexus pectinivorans]TCO06013.1 diketogulonate reductase-like aldo/keto reductase [Natronoflexus pectinivorans]
MKLTDIKGTVTLANGVEMPYFGLGVFKSREGSEVINSVTWALEAGYRHIDTATIYENEEGVGEAISNAHLNRDEVFITSKVWNSDQGFDNTLKAFDESLKRLSTDYLDLYLVHWPVKGKYKETWKALEKLYKDGRVRAIGVSNFLAHHLDDLIQDCDVKPMVNQFEFHPRLVQPDLVKKCLELNIRPEAWSPLMQGEVFDIKELQKMANKYSKNVAQVVLRWNLQKGIITIPKSANKNRIESNAQIFDFEISEDDMKAIDKLDQNRRVGADPDNFNF